VSWESVGFPVIDRSGYGKLRGMDIVELTTSEDKYTLPRYYRGKKDYQKGKTNTKESEDGEEYFDNDDLEQSERHDNSQRRLEEALDNLQDRPLLLLCQQSEIGDVYCQRIEITSKHAGRSAPIQIK
jgi:hypothetical protein